MAGVQGKSNQVSVRLARPWSSTQSSFARTLGERAMAQSILHLDAHRRLWWINISFVLPTIILSLLGGACNSSQSSLVALWPPEKQEHVGKVLPLILGLVGLMVSVLNSVQSYLGTARLVESHWIAHTGFSKLQRLIASEVSLPHQERSVGGTEAIGNWRAQYDQLLENSPSISVKLEKRFSNRRDVRKAGIIVPPNIKVRGIQTFEDMQQQQQQQQQQLQQQLQLQQKKGGSRLKRATSRMMIGNSGRKKAETVSHFMTSAPPPSPPAADAPSKPARNRNRRETQLELQELQAFGAGRVASIAKGGLRPPSPSSSSDGSEIVPAPAPATRSTVGRRSSVTSSSPSVSSSSRDESPPPSSKAGSQAAGYDAALHDEDS